MDTLLQSFSETVRTDPSKENEAILHFAVLSFFFYWGTYFIFHGFMHLMPTGEFKRLSNEKQADYISRLNANLHAVFATIFALIGMVYQW